MAELNRRIGPSTWHMAAELRRRVKADLRKFHPDLTIHS